MQSKRRQRCVCVPLSQDTLPCCTCLCSELNSDALLDKLWVRVPPCQDVRLGGFWYMRACSPAPPPRPAF